LPRGAEFHVWIPGGLVLVTDGTTLYQWDTHGGAAWVAVADLGPMGLKGVTRLALSPSGDRLVLVARDRAP
jgi:hypothetical protein